jgi:CBS domain-containing protein
LKEARMQAACARDVMLPLDDVPTIHESATLRDAVRALALAQERRPPGRPPYRAVLVVNDGGQVVGKLGHLSFLAALEPGHEPLEALDRAGLAPDLIASISDHLRLLRPGIEDLCLRAAHLRVGDVMRRLDESIDEHAPLSEAIASLVRLQTLSILVRRGTEVVGLLRLADLYDLVAGMIDRERATERSEGD